MQLARSARALVASSIFAIFAASTPTAAASTTIVLEYQVASEARGCPDTESFRASVVRQLGHDPFVIEAERRVAVLISRTPLGFTGRIRWTEAGARRTGERRLASRRSECASMARELAFSVAVHVQLLETLGPNDSKATQAAADPSAESATSPPSPEAATATAPTATATPPPTPTSPPAPAVPAAPLVPAAVEPGGVPATTALPAAETTLPPAAPSGSDPSRLLLSVGLGPSFAFGISPRPTELGRLFVSGRIARVSMELALDASWPVTQQTADAGGFKLDRVSVGTAACGHTGVLAGCLLGTVGALRARGFGVDQPASPTGVFFQVGARIAARLPLGGRYFAAAHADGLLLPSSWTVKLNGVPAWVTPRTSALLGVDFGAAF